MITRFIRVMRPFSRPGRRCQGSWGFLAPNQQWIAARYMRAEAVIGALSVKTRRCEDDQVHKVPGFVENTYIHGYGIRANMSPWVRTPGGQAKLARLRAGGGRRGLPIAPSNACNTATRPTKLCRERNQTQARAFEGATRKRLQMRWLCDQGCGPGRRSRLGPCRIVCISPQCG